MIRSVLLWALALALAASVRAADFVAPTLSAAARAVALRNPALALPPGVSAAELAVLPADSAVWRRAAEEMTKASVVDYMGLGQKDDPVVIVRDALVAVQKAAQSQIEKGSEQDWTQTGELKPLLTQASREKLGAILSRLNLEASALQGPASDLWTDASLSPEAVVLQAETQKSKISYRGFDWTENDLRAGAVWRKASSPDAALHRALTQPHPLRALIEQATERHGKLVWADVGGGAGLLQRDWSSKNQGSGAKTILVDMLDWERMPASDEQRAKFKANAALFAPELRPELRLADAATVSFSQSERPNLITAFHSIQYWPDKLKAIANLYNEAADGAVLLFSSDYAWPTRLVGATPRTFKENLAAARRFLADLFNNRPRAKTGSTIQRFLTALNDGGIEALTTAPDSQSDILQSIAIVKKPGTRLELRSPLEYTVTHPNGYVDSRYRRDPHPPVAVAETAQLPRKKL